MSETFKTYERVKTERVEVATITEENIHLIAKAVGGTVDYSGDEPCIFTKDKPDFRWKMGWEVRSSGSGLVNMNGFNRDGDWREVE